MEGGAAPPSQGDVWLPRILAGFAGAPAVLGVIKALAESGTGRPFTLGDAAYYVGYAALGAYAGFFVMWLAGLLNWLLTEVFGVDEKEIDSLIIGVAVVLFVGTIVVVVLSAPPPGDGDAFFRVIGVLTVVGACIAYAAHRNSQTQVR